MHLPDRAQKILHRVIDLAMVPLVEDRLVVTGFWRSGTTWVQQQAAHAMHAKTVFEPLAPSSGNFWSDRAFAGDTANCEIYMPLSYDDLGQKAETIVTAALAGRGHTGFAFFCRQSQGEAFRRRVVAKFTRAGFLLGEMERRSGAKFLHVRRHPGAVFASLKNVDWAWSIADVSLSKTYGAKPMCESAESAEIRKLLLTHDSSPVRRIAALWALSERAAHEAARASPDDRIVELAYSDLVTRQTCLSGALEKLGLQPQTEPDIARISPVTATDRHLTGPHERLNGWQDELSLAEQDELRAVTSDLFPEMASVFWDEPSVTVPLTAVSGG